MENVRQHRNIELVHNETRLRKVAAKPSYKTSIIFNEDLIAVEGWSGGAMVLGKLPVPGRPTIWMTVGQGPSALAVGAGGGCLDIFSLICPFFPLSPSLWETARYRLKYCLKGPLNPEQPTNLIAVELYKTNVKLFKPIYCGMSILG